MCICVYLPVLAHCFTVVLGCGDITFPVWPYPLVLALFPLPLFVLMFHHFLRVPFSYFWVLSSNFFDLFIKISPTESIKQPPTFLLELLFDLFPFSIWNHSIWWFPIRSIWNHYLIYVLFFPFKKIAYSICMAKGVGYSGSGIGRWPPCTLKWLDIVS